MKSAFHRNKVTLSFVMLLSHIAPCPLVDRQMFHASVILPSRSNLVGGTWNSGFTMVRALNRAALSIYPGPLQPREDPP
jgi:hypothetical protein